MLCDTALARRYWLWVEISVSGLVSQAWGPGFHLSTTKIHKLKQGGSHSDLAVISHDQMISAPPPSVFTWYPCFPGKSGQFCNFQGQSCYLLITIQARRAVLNYVSILQFPACRFLHGFNTTGIVPVLSSVPCSPRGLCYPLAGSKLGQSSENIVYLQS